MRDIRSLLIQLGSDFSIGEKIMPIKKVKGGYKWGDSGKVYKKREDALKQGRAIKASENKKKKKKKT